MKTVRMRWAGLVPVHHLFKISGVAARIGLIATPLSFALATPAIAADRNEASAPVAAQSAKVVGSGIAAFYASRHDYPLWLSPTAGQSAERLIDLLQSANLDGLDPARYSIGSLRAALAVAKSGKRDDILRADRLLSQAFLAYVSDVRADPNIGILYVDKQLKPGLPAAFFLLNDVFRAPSPAAYLDSFAWVNPIYVQLRKALASDRYSAEQKAQIRVNMDRARVLPITAKRYILVNAAEQKLFMFEDGKQVDDMRVVVGQVKWPTPMIVALVRFAALNPYWYVPPDLAWEDVGEPVSKYGQKYFDRMGYEYVSDWAPGAAVLDPKTIDWKKVRDGTSQVYIRQKPGPGNFMGRMKFMFPNEAGVYLHDNPRKELFEKDVRYFSGGCVRLSDAARLGRWLFGHDLQWEGVEPETQIALDTPVPVYITYLTAKPTVDGSIAFFDDAYGRDKKALAGVSDAPVHAKDSAVGSPDGVN